MTALSTSNHPRVPDDAGVPLVGLGTLAVDAALARGAAALHRCGDRARPTVACQRPAAFLVGGLATGGLGHRQEARR